MLTLINLAGLRLAIGTIYFSCRACCFCPSLKALNHWDLQKYDHKTKNTQIFHARCNGCTCSINSCLHSHRFFTWAKRQRSTTSLCQERFLGICSTGSQFGDFISLLSTSMQGIGNEIQLHLHGLMPDSVVPNSCND